VSRNILTLVLVCTFASLATSQEPIRFARTPDISPDGKLITFSYLGDIWTVEAIGGVARPVTLHEAHDVNPCFSPDGRWIAFSSNRHGQYDVFVVPTVGGKAKRLTFDSAQDLVSGWSKDGKSILFSSSRSNSYPAAIEHYQISKEGGQEKKLPYKEAKEVAISPNGTTVAFVRGPGTWYRKGYRGSSNDDIWLSSVDGATVRRLTEFNGQDSAPMWSSDAKKLFYVSETAGTANIVAQELSTSTGLPTAVGAAKPLTQHKEDSVRRARINSSGDWIVYECGGDLWICSTKDGVSRKLAIEVHADDKSNTDRVVTFNKDISEYTLSPDENTIAFVVHGEIFTMPTRGGKANRITDTSAVEHSVIFSPDNKKLLFVSDRSGYEELYLLESDDPDYSDLSKASKYKTKALTNSPEAEFGASFNNNGSLIAFIRSGKLYTMKTDGTDVKPLVDQPQVFDYEWSPDGKWLAYSRSDGSFASEIYIIPSDGSKPAVNVSRYATYNAGITWGSNKLAFLSQRRGSMGMHVLSLQKPGGSSSSSTSDIDWDDIHLRVERPSSLAAAEGAISKNGRSIAFRSTGNGDDLWVAATDGSNIQRVTQGNLSPRQIRWTKGGTVYFLDGTGSIRSTMPGVSSFTSGSREGANAPSSINFTAKMTIGRDEEFQEMFDQSWRFLSDSFYDSKHHGNDWKQTREKYRALVKHVAMKEDLFNLVSLMLGELNASHLGISGTIRTPEEQTADLGLIFDESYTGPGLKVAEIIKRGPSDRRGVGLKPGDVILAIDRTELSDKTNLSQLLNSKTSENVTLEVVANPAETKNRRKIELQPTSRDKVGQLLYDRWIEKNAAEVAKLSGGRIGYIHISGMDEQGLEQFVRSLYSDNFDKDAIVIDVRYNGGGFTHDQVLNYLGAKEHTFFRQRDGGEGLVMRNYDRKWTKPSTVLINNRSFSDAEIFPSAYRSLGLGKVIGQATGGMVIGTTSTRLIDGSQFRLPRTGVYTVKGINMEKEGVAPDIAVDVTPEDLAKGVDPQLSKAVDVLKVEVAEWKKNRSNPSSGTATTAAPAPAPVSPMPPAAK
jgi:tricorn protease